MLKELIIGTIEEVVASADTETEYRKPLVGFANANDEEFESLKEIVAPEYKFPTDILANAKSVVAFFIPFAKEVVELNQQQQDCAPEWAIAYHETNVLISQICDSLKNEMDKIGVKVGWESPTYNFDKERLLSFWSHRSAAKICGLGDFGLNQMLISKQGSAGRYGSIVIDRQVIPSQKINKSLCLYYRNGSCGVCVDSCPTGALTKEGLNKDLCYKMCLENDQVFKEKFDRLNDIFDVCGKCQTGPCAYSIPDCTKE